MTANKTKSNLKNMLCSHQCGDPLFGHRLSMGFFFISLIMGGATMQRHGHILFFKNRSLVGSGKG
jgi:hypothetical protein